MIFITGSNYFGQLGVGNVQFDDPYLPMSLDSDKDLATNEYESFDQIKDAQCGGNFTILLYKNGSVKFCGAINSIIHPNISSLSISLPLKCIQVACGRKHSLLLMERSIVMSYGSGIFGQLGHGDDTSWDSPRLISFLEPRRLGCTVQYVACGGSHSGVITKSGRVFMWGLNRAGQCGQATKNDSILEPTPVDIFGNVLSHETVNQLVCGRNHSGIITGSGKVFVWGDSTQEIPVISMKMGDLHTIALTVNGHVYSWGSGMNGQTGHSTVLNLRTPKRIEFFDELSVKSIGCGATWSFAITQTGTLFTWGYGDGGWLGLKPPKYLERVDTDNPLQVTNRLNNLSYLRCFDSRMDVINPQPVEHLLNRFVEYVSAGAGHMIIITSNLVRTIHSDAIHFSQNHEENDINYESKSLIVEEKYAKQISDSTIDSNIISDKNSSAILSKSKYINKSVSSKSDSKHTDDNISPLSTGTGIKSFSPQGNNNQTAFSPSNPGNQIFNFCRHKKIVELKKLLSDGIDVNIQDSAGNTPLIVACQNGHLLVCKALVDQGALVNASNLKGNTALHYSFNYGYEDIGNYLISCGADEFQINNEGLTCYEGLTQSDLDLL